MRSLSIGILAVWFGCVCLQSQTTFGTIPVLSEGTSFMVAFPKVWAESSERPLPQPMVLVITSSVPTRIRVTTPAADGSLNKIDKSYSVTPNRSLKIPIPIVYLPEDAPSISGRGVQITSEHPISVYTYQTWQGNGEMAQHLPEHAWGTSYTTMNSFQDRFGTSATGFQERPAQILVIAREDSTNVTIVPTIDLQNGPSIDRHPRGVARTYLLNRGQTLYTTGAIIPGKHRDYASDLSGTTIRSSKPVAVISGHTKGAFLRMPDVLPTTGPFSSPAHFVRNNIHDAMHPHSFAGNSFVTTPFRYTYTRVTGQLFPGADNDRGDVIRVIALSNNTVVRRSNNIDSVMTTVATLDSGESFVDTAVDERHYWESNHPVLMGQYGKSWAKYLPPFIPKAETNGNVVGHPTVEAGMPCMQMVPPIDRWINRAVFEHMEGMDNYIHITFRMSETSMILIDGRPLTQTYAGTISRVGNTEYGSCNAFIRAGTMAITSTNPDVRWMAWTSGSLDGLQQGRAYATPVGVNTAMPYDDSLDLSLTLTCTEATGTITIKGDERSSFAYVELLDSANVSWDYADSSVIGRRVFSFRIPRRSQDVQGTCRLRAVTTSGRFVERIFIFEPASQLTASQTLLDVGQLSSFDDRLDTVRILSGSAEPVRASLSLTDGKSVRIVSDPIVTVSSTSPAIAVLSSRGRTHGQQIDTLHATTVCGGMDHVLTIRGRYTPPQFEVSMPTFSNVARDRDHVDTIVIHHRGPTRVALRSVRAAALVGDSTAFACTTLDGTAFANALPMVLDSGQTVRLLLRFRSVGDVDRFETQYRVVTSDDNVVVTLRARATVSDTTTSVNGDDIAGRLTVVVAPSPVVDDAHITLTSSEGGRCAITITDVAGRIVHSFDADLTAERSHTLPLPHVHTLPSGAYILTATVGTRTVSTRLNLVR